MAAILNEINRNNSDMTAVEIATKYNITQSSAIKIRKKLNTAKSLGIKFEPIEKLTEIDRLIEKN